MTCGEWDGVPPPSATQGRGGSGSDGHWQLEAAVHGEIACMHETGMRVRVVCVHTTQLHVRKHMRANTRLGCTGHIAYLGDFGVCAGLCAASRVWVICGKGDLRLLPQPKPPSQLWRVHVMRSTVVLGKRAHKKLYLFSPRDSP